MDLYSSAGLENFDCGNLKGVVVNVMSSVADLRKIYTCLIELCAGLKSPSDTEEVEVFFSNNKKSENFYNLLCAFDKTLNVVLNVKQMYSALPKDELKNTKTLLSFSPKYTAV